MHVGLPGALCSLPFDFLLPTGCDLIFGDSLAPALGRKVSICIETIPYAVGSFPAAQH